MHHQFINSLRQSTRHHTALHVTLEDVADELAAPASAADLGTDLQRCLLLQADQREVLLLVSMEGMQYQEVARVTGVPIGTVMSRLARARTRLQALLEAPAKAHPALGEETLPALRRLK
jgi:RNA polymerase sigma factor (sigma-70 family)